MPVSSQLTSPKVKGQSQLVEQMAIEKTKIYLWEKGYWVLREQQKRGPADLYAYKIVENRKIDYFIDANATDSFALYNNEALDSAVNGSSFGTYTSGGTFTVPIGIGNFLFNNLISSAETIAFDNFI